MIDSKMGKKQKDRHKDLALSHEPKDPVSETQDQSARKLKKLK